MLRRRTAHRTRFYSLRWVTPLVLVVPFGLVAGCVVFMVAVASKPDGSAGVAIAGVLTLPALGMAGWGASLTLRPVTLTRSALRIPNGFKTVVISLDDVAGVGLLCYDFRPNTRSARTWSVFVWSRNGSVQHAGTLICRRGPDAPPSRIAASRTARMAKRLDAKIRAAQGPAGSLAALELQKHAFSGLAYYVAAFWSPDGEMGLIRY